MKRPIAFLVLGAALVAPSVTHIRTLDAASGRADERLVMKIEELTRTVAVLTERVDSLEAAARTRPIAQGGGQRIVAPFEVVDRSGKPLFGVSDVPFPSLTRKPRVHIGPGTANNYVLRVMTSGGVEAATFGEQKVGGGSFTVHTKEGAERVVITGEKGVEVNGANKKQVIFLGPDAAGTRAHVAVYGTVRVLSAAQKLLFEAGASTEGGGLANVFADDGTMRVQLDRKGVTTYSPSKKSVISLGYNSKDPESGYVRLTGTMGRARTMSTVHSVGSAGMAIR